MPKELLVFAGNASRDLAARICQTPAFRLGDAVVSRFNDGEIQVEISEDVRGSDSFIVQSTCHPSTVHLMELILIADALRRSSAHCVTAVIPYFGYTRQDRRPRSRRVPIAAKVVANMIFTSGIDRVITVDLHAAQVQGFFDIPLDNVFASPLFIEHLSANRRQGITIVSPDTGGVARARTLSSQIKDSHLAIIDRRRLGSDDSVRDLQLIGEVDGQHCVIIDDLVDTGSTICQAAELLKARGAASVCAYATHGVLSQGAVTRIEKASIDHLVITDTIPASEMVVKSSKITVLSVASLVAETMRRVQIGESVSAMFSP